jgi:hypothetical protein
MADGEGSKNATDEKSQRRSVNYVPKTCIFVLFEFQVFFNVYRPFTRAWHRHVVRVGLHKNRLGFNGLNLLILVSKAPNA